MFVNQNQLVQHVKCKHSDWTPFKCDHVNDDQTLCGHGCKTQVHLNPHTQTHLEVKRHQCSECSKSYGKLQHLRYHVDTIHKGIVVNFKCPDCHNEYGCPNTDVPTRCTSIVCSNIPIGPTRKLWRDSNSTSRRAMKFARDGTQESTDSSKT